VRDGNTVRFVANMSTGFADGAARVAAEELTKRVLHIALGPAPPACESCKAHLETIDELKRENADLRRETAELRRENAELRRENARLKKRVARLEAQVQYLLSRQRRDEDGDQENGAPETFEDEEIVL